MLADGYISTAALGMAMAEPIQARETFTESNDAPYFVDYVKHELAERYPPEVLTGEGLRIFTTLDIHTERLAEHAVADEPGQAGGKASAAAAQGSSTTGSKRRWWRSNRKAARSARWWADAITAPASSTASSSPIASPVPSSNRLPTWPRLRKR